MTGSRDQSDPAWIRPWLLGNNPVCPLSHKAIYYILVIDQGLERAGFDLPFYTLKVNIFIKKTTWFMHFQVELYWRNTRVAQMLICLLFI